MGAFKIFKFGMAKKPVKKPSAKKVHKIPKKVKINHKPNKVMKMAQKKVIQKKNDQKKVIKKVVNTAKPANNSDKRSLFLKKIFVVIDGLGDLPNAEINKKTPLEDAKKDSLDFFAKQSTLLRVSTFKNIAPESDVAVTSILGYNPDSSFTGRGPLECYGAGLDVKPGDLCLRINLATVFQDEKGLRIIDRRAGRIISTSEGREIERIINKIKFKVPFRYKFTLGHRGVLVFKGNWSDEISNGDPAYHKKGNYSIIKEHKHKHELPENLYFEKIKPLESGKKAQDTANMLNEFLMEVRKHLTNELDLNQKRIQEEKLPINFILVRDAGNKLPVFKPRKKNWASVTSMPLEMGLSKLMGMSVLKFDYPEFEGSHVYENLYDGLATTIAESILKIKRYWKKFDGFYIHLKETDIPGHDGLPKEKSKMIELIDQTFFKYLKNLHDEGYKFEMIVTADHSTPCKLKRHSSDPIPAFYFNSYELKEGKSYTESNCAKGKHIAALDLFPKFFKQ